MPQKQQNTIELLTYSGSWGDAKWKLAKNNNHCVYVECLKCNKHYHLNSGKAITKHEGTCKNENSNSLRTDRLSN